MAFAGTRVRWKAAFVALSLCLCCAPASGNKGKDGFFFTAPEWSAPEFTVRLIEYASEIDLARAAPNGVKVHKHNKVGAWSRVRWTINDDGSKAYSCEIHIISLERAYRPELLGHEIAHCAKGRWHREPEA